jgi:hypothetical protein
LVKDLTRADARRVNDLVLLNPKSVSPGGAQPGYRTIKFKTV